MRTAVAPKVLHPLKNPANKSQSFEVLEIWAPFTKGVTE